MKFIFTIITAGLLCFLTNNAIAFNCDYPKFPVNGACAVVNCPKGDEIECTSLEDNCTSKNQQAPSCRGNKTCDCSPSFVHQPQYLPKPACNKSLNSNDKSAKGQVCDPKSNQCIKDPHCSLFGDACSFTQ
jgi:hypothetical protein